MSKDGSLYFDTNVYLAYFLGENNELMHSDPQKINNELNQFKLSQQYFDSNCEIFFPNLLGAEIFTSIRSALSKNPRYRDETKVNQESTKLFQNIISRISKQENFRFEGSKSNSVNLNQVVANSSPIMMSIKGTFKKYHKCDSCGKHGEQHVYKILSIMDVLHVFLAKEFGCKKFVTFDQYFNEIRGHRDIQPLEIEIISRN